MSNIQTSTLSSGALDMESAIQMFQEYGWNGDYIIRNALSSGEVIDHGMFSVFYRPVKGEDIFFVHIYARGAASFLRR